jgi:hypothetical protein
VNRNAVYIRVLLVLIALVVLLTFLNRTPHRSSGDAWLPSSFNPSGAGHMAFYETLEDLHWPVERWRVPLSRLSEYGTGNTLVITRSLVATRVRFSDEEIGLVTNWVRKGNTLVLLGALTRWDDTRAWLRELGFVVPAGEPGNLTTSFLHPFETKAEEKISMPSPLGTLVLPPSQPLPVIGPPDARTLAAQDGQPYLLTLPCGAGRIVCGASARLLDNSFLQQGDNLAIVLRLLAPDGQVPRHLFFEESHHGFTAIFALLRLLEHPGVRFAGMLALLGVLTFLGSSLVRFGPIVPLHPAAGRSTLEFVDSIADLYQRADLRNAMIDSLFRETHQRVLHRLNLPPAAPHELISTRLQQAYPKLPRWKKLAQRFDSTEHIGGLPPSGWMRLARELIEIKSAMA